MFLKLILITAVLLGITIAIGVMQDRQTALANTLQGCTQVSDNSGYIGYECPDSHLYVPASERNLLETK